VVAAGLYAMAEVVMQIRGGADKHQVKKAKTGLVHGVTGSAANPLRVGTR